MEEIDRLAFLLMAERGFQRREPDPAPPATGNLELAEQRTLLADPPPFGFVGTRAHWGRASIALVDADDLDLAGMEQFASRFFTLVYEDYSAFGPSHGILCFLFPETPRSSDHQVHPQSQALRAAKHGLHGGLDD